MKRKETCPLSSVKVVQAVGIAVVNSLQAG